MEYTVCAVFFIKVIKMHVQCKCILYPNSHRACQIYATFEAWKNLEYAQTSVNISLLVLDT